jgi:hypothetical protein
MKRDENSDQNIQNGNRILAFVKHVKTEARVHGIVQKVETDGLKDCLDRTDRTAKLMQPVQPKQVDALVTSCHILSHLVTLFYHGENSQNTVHLCTKSFASCESEHPNTWS